MLKRIISNIKTNQQLRRKVETGNKAQDNVWLYNFWKVRAEDMWLTRFLRYHGLMPSNKRFSFYSVFGNRRVVNYDNREVKIFITGENVHSHNFRAYSDNMLSEKKIDLSLGFDYIDDARYVRMPLWLRTQFAPEWSEKEIIEHVNRLRYPGIGERDKFAALVARYDWGNTRSQIYESLKNVGHIQCPSKVLHNDETLKTEFNDDKPAYLRQFCFNVCPENSNYKGYVTEKMFDAVASGCIPIYWGSDNQPEPDVLNHEAIILWSIGGDNSQNVSKIQHLWENKGELNDFLHQPRLKDGAEEKILLMFNKLEDKFKQVLS